MLKILMLSVLIALTSNSFAQTNMPEGFIDGKNCVSYTVRETVMFLYDRDVVGVNCNVTVEFNGDKDQYRFSTIIPLADFDTGNSTRDKNVREILGQSRSDNLFMVTEWRPLSEWKQMVGQPAYQHTGYLTIGENVITLPHFSAQNMAAGTKFVTGFADFKFSDFNLTPPKVLGGLWVAAHEDIRLHFRFYHSEMEGLEKLTE